MPLDAICLTAVARELRQAVTAALSPDFPAVLLDLNPRT